MKVAELAYFPIKGCAGVSAPNAVLTPRGLDHDRSFMVTNADGAYVTQRYHPALALIRPEITADGGKLTLRTSGMETLTINVDVTGPRREVDLFGARYTGIDQGNTIAEWLSEALNISSRLVRVPPEHDRRTNGLTPGTSGYADSCPVHLLSRCSLDHLNERMAIRGAESLPVNRFRPNIVVEGCEEPHIEDQMRRITIGDAEFGYAKLAIRCVVTTVQQESGMKNGPEPIRTLAAYRRAAEGGVALGVKFAVLREGKLSVGDPVTVDAWGESELG